MTFSFFLASVFLEGPPFWPPPAEEEGLGGIFYVDFF